MVVEKMSLAVINANSPYEVKVALADDTLCFITDYDADIIIGTTAIINNMVMVTENVKHIGRLNGIVVENWMEK
jgi:predicted nucleic acid-binding protein